MSKYIEFTPNQAIVAIRSSPFIRKIYQYHSGYSLDDSLISNREKMYIYIIRQTYNWRYNIDKIILNEINKYINYDGDGLGSINNYFSKISKKINNDVKDRILKTIWAPSRFIIFQNKFLEWNYRPGNPGYIRTLHHYNSLQN